MKKTIKAVAAMSLFTAKKAAGEASQWLAYQPREPKTLKKLVSKK